MSYTKILFIVLIFLHFWPANVFSQYFGRNKPSYRIFNYDALYTPNFEIYHYLKNDTFITQFAEWSEEWYVMHQKVFPYFAIPFQNGGWQNKNFGLNFVPGW